jgi:hypothetical protein
MRFVKGHLAFTLDGKPQEFIHQNLSAFGVTGLPWGPLDPALHFGREVDVQVRIPAEKSAQFTTRATILRENTLFGSHMGLRFRLEPAARAMVESLVRKIGFTPTEYLRKYPRIPSAENIATFPMRVLGMPEGADLNHPLPTSFDVGDLSPNGVLLSTENQAAMEIAPGARIDLVLEPRGWFPHSVRVLGLVCRVSDEKHPTSGNLIRYLGIKFVRVDEPNRLAFLDLLKDILHRIKKSP